MPPDVKAQVHKIRFPWGFAPDPAEGAYTAPPGSLAVYKGAYF